MKIPVWSQLRITANTLAGKLAILMPLLGYIIVYKARSANTLAKQLPNLSAFLSEVPILNIYLTYFGLCLFGVGSFVFQIFCEQTIKSFPSSRDYLVAQSSSVSAIELTEIIRLILPSLTKGSDRYEHLSLYLKAIPAGKSVQNDELRSLTLTEYYKYLDNCHIVARASSALMMYLGLLLLIIPTLRTFYDIVRMAVS